MRGKTRQIRKLRDTSGTLHNDLTEKPIFVILVFIFAREFLENVFDIVENFQCAACRCSIEPSTCRTDNCADAAHYCTAPRYLARRGGGGGALRARASSFSKSCQKLLLCKGALFKCNREAGINVICNAPNKLTQWQRRNLKRYLVIGGNMNFLK